MVMILKNILKNVLINVPNKNREMVRKNTVLLENTKMW